MSYRTWTFTWNNPPPDANERIRGFVTDGLVRYAIAGAEISPTTGTPHLQGVITFTRTHRLPGARNILGGCHLEPCRSRDAAIEYCKKEGDFEEFGTPPRAGQGKRTDLSDAIATYLESGLDAVKRLHPLVYVKYPRGLATLGVDQPRDAPPTVTWIYGRTGVGKTRQVVDLESDLWISGGSLRWWDGYDCHAAVLFDDFRGDFCTFHWLLRLLDRYPVRVEIKGGSREFNSPRIYITCPHHPRDVYRTIEDKLQLFRRISRIVHAHGDDWWTRPTVPRNPNTYPIDTTFNIPY